MTKANYPQIFYYDEDFKEVLDMCKKMFKKDKAINNSIPEKMKLLISKNGNFSWGIRYLINNYVQINKPGFLRSIANATTVNPISQVDKEN